MNEKKWILFVLLFFTCAVTGCTLGHSKPDATISSSTIFTSQIQEKTTEIMIYPNDTGIKIDNREDIDKLYHLLSSLSLTQTSKQESDIDGGLTIEIITGDSTIQFHLTSNILGINNIIYSFDSDLLQDITNIYEAYL